ncbi:general secretion pathway protein GspB [Schlegelella sp. S2-27]|uniref:General secretion pathway protein GspB n=1 Tax=Caldimonas mangrovi TaxID=2944811 RepID=A0ABT0YVI0_9BURK|nr:general secretion pathway protein GspB [Caldimonas mangrovi]MCM5682761.1 general secretion pathway protein GspB [Caldimonas mangrovi]
MSYILDALRRADSERERGSVPGLHTQPVPPGSAHTRTTASSRPWAWIAVGISLGLLIPLAWLALGRETPHATVALAPPAPTPAPAVAAPPSLPADPPPAPVPPVVVTPPTAPPVVERAAPSPPPPSPAPAPVAVAAAVAPPPVPAAGSRIHTPSELPDDVRRSLPALSVGGSVYSSNPSDRVLILNGRPFREGDQPTPDLTLEEIRLKSAVLRFRNYRYAISY